MSKPEQIIDKSVPDESELWYGLCGYWTDDWSKLANQPGIPVCPICSAPGFVTEVARWWREVDEYERLGHPGYRAFIERTRATCYGRSEDPTMPRILHEYETSPERAQASGKLN